LKPADTLTLFAFAGAAILLGHAIPETLTGPLETAVGVMLVGLGARVLWRMWRDRVHFHRHRHADGIVHLHAPSHRSETRRMRKTRTRTPTAFAGARRWSA
jgi:ascorbate-specific PTS system EIIC-type component UlaA